jgi:hypothetical protein
LEAKSAEDLRLRGGRRLRQQDAALTRALEAKAKAEHNEKLRRVREENIRKIEVQRTHRLLQALKGN